MVEAEEGRSLTGTPTWAVGTVITVMVTLGFFFQASLEQFGKWLDRTKRKALLAALDKIKDELMLFGLLSLLMGHWIIYVAKICVKSSALSRRFYPCALASELSDASSLNHISVSSSSFMNYSASRHLMNDVMDDYCPEGHESFASRESLEQLHRFLFVLGITHVFYSFVAIALAMIKIYSWRIWENQAKSMALQGSQGSSEAASSGLRMRRLSTFISHQTSHSWSQHRVLVWLLCFSRQFWSSINRADYMALRFGFLTAHQLPLAYDFHNYMLRSMEEEFRDIVGISVPLWIFGIACILLGFHGTNIYFWLSFLPVILILLVGTKLHRIVVKLAVEIMEASPWGESQKFNLRDELFWFRKPRLLLRLIQFISFQNAFEMASFLWSLLKAMRLKELAKDLENQRQKNDAKGKRKITDKTDIAGTTPEGTETVLQDIIQAMPHDAHPMGVLVSAMSTLSIFHPDANPALKGQDLYKSKQVRDKQIVRILGKAPTIAAATYLRMAGRPPVLPSSNLSYSENFLYMLDSLGNRSYSPNPRLARVLDILFILHAEHQMNCSTAAARHLASRLCLRC